jgi:hypothetical protein
MTVMKNPFIKNPSAGLATTAQDSKPKKRDNTFSKSRETREDRGARQMKTSHNSQTFTHTP